jgi:hypothetical protein
MKHETWNMDQGKRPFEFVVQHFADFISGFRLILCRGVVSPLENGFGRKE